MVRILTVILFFLTSLILPAQLLEATDYHTESGPIIRPHHALRSSTTQVFDTLELPYVRRSANRALTLNNSTSAAAIGQYYEAPGQVTISGFEFFAYQSDATSNATVNLTCAIYAANGTLPTGAPIAEVIVPVAKQINTNLEFTRRVARFNSPVTISGPFILVVQNPTSISVGVYCNNWDVRDGDSEFLASFFFLGGWTPAASVTVGSVPFDADGYLLPFVEYDFNHSFTVSERCLTGNDQIRLQVQPSSFRDNRFYNKSVFQGRSGRQLLSWNLGQNGPAASFTDSTVLYATPMRYSLSLTTDHQLWSSNRTFVYKDSIDVEPLADFDFLVNGYDVTFTNLSQGAGSYRWSFGDSVYASLAQPVYRYPSPGQYQVTLIVRNGCAADTVTRVVNIVPNGVSTSSRTQWQAFPNPTTGAIMLADLPETATALVITDLAGRYLSTQPLDNTHQSITIHHLPTGNYVLLLMVGNQPVDSRLITKVDQ